MRQTEMWGILGTGSYLPPFIVENKDFEKFIDTSDEWIRSRTGIQTRHIAWDVPTQDMALNAAEAALKASRTAPGELELIICATITSDVVVPSLACTIMQRLGANCPAFDLNAACTGFIYALYVAWQMAKSTKYRRVLILGVEKLSTVTNWEDRSTCVLFGDGAGAAVLGEGGGDILFCDIQAYPDTDGALRCAGINEGGAHDVAWPGQQPVQPSCISMDGKKIYAFATRVLSKNLAHAMDACGLSQEDVALVIPHQANERIIAAASSKLAFPAERVYRNIAASGNTSSASIPIALDEAVQNGRIRRGDIVLLGGFGGGLTAGTAVLRW